MSCRKVKKHTTDKWDEPRLPGGQAFCGLAAVADCRVFRTSVVQ